MDTEHPALARPGRARRELGLATMVVSLLVAIWPATPFWGLMTGITVALAIGLPLVLSDAPRLATRVLFVAAVGVVVIAATYAAARSGDGGLEPRNRMHDGGVIVTEAAADEIRHGRNPYTADYRPALPASWQEVQALDGRLLPNPVVDHFPYLPAAALVHVPFAAAGAAAGTGWDTRVLSCIVFAAAVVALARRSGPPAWARLGAVLGLGSMLAVLFQGWGTNDVFAVAMALLALCVAEERPGLAGALLAVAVSAKLLLVVLLLPLVVAVWVIGGWVAVRRWWTFPAVMVATCLPFLLMAPAAFLDDTVWFNLGRSDVNMPTSGIGIPAVAPTFDGAPLAVITVLGLVLAVAGPLWVVWRWPSIWVAASSAGVALLLLLVPARTFQTNYLVLVAALIPALWLAVGADGRVAITSRAGSSPPG